MRLHPIRDFELVECSFVRNDGHGRRGMLAVECCVCRRSYFISAIVAFCSLLSGQIPKPKSRRFFVFVDERRPESPQDWATN